MYINVVYVTTLRFKINFGGQLHKKNRRKKNKNA